MGTLYVVSTPIGNLEDISLRALRVLREVVLIAAEDTREARKLLTHYAIHTRLLSYHAHNEQARVEPILAALAAPGWLTDDAGVVVERSAAAGPPTLPAAWRVAWERVYGDTLVVLTGPDAGGRTA